MRCSGDNRITSLRFLIDFSFPSRDPAFCAAMRERFGDDAIRITKTHCKFILVRADAWRLVIRTSMNLNLNRALENFEISDDPELFAHLEDFVAGLFADFRDGEQFDKAPGENARDFYSRTGATSAEADELWKLDDSRESYFGDGALDRDVRRTGLTTKAGKL